MVLDLRGHVYSSPFTSSTHQRAPSTQGSSSCATLTGQAHRHFNGSPWEYQYRSCFRIEPAPTTATGHRPRLPAQSSLFTLRLIPNQHCNLGQASPLSLFSWRMLNPESGLAVRPSPPMLSTPHDRDLSCRTYQLWWRAHRLRLCQRARRVRQGFRSSCGKRRSRSRIIHNRSPPTRRRWVKSRAVRK